MSAIGNEKPNKSNRYLNWSFTLTSSLFPSVNVEPTSFTALPIASQVFLPCMRYLVLTKEYDDGSLYVKGFVSYKTKKSLKYVKSAFNGSVATAEPTTSVVSTIKDIRRGIFTEAGTYIRKGPSKSRNKMWKETLPKIITSEDTVLISGLSVPTPELILAIANEPEEIN